MRQQEIQGCKVRWMHLHVYQSYSQVFLFSHRTFQIESTEQVVARRKKMMQHRKRNCLSTSLFIMDISISNINNPAPPPPTQQKQVFIYLQGCTSLLGAFFPQAFLYWTAGFKSLKAFTAWLVKKRDCLENLTDSRLRISTWQMCVKKSVRIISSGEIPNDSSRPAFQQAF